LYVFTLFFQCFGFIKLFLKSTVINTIKAHIVKTVVAQFQRMHICKSPVPYVCTTCFL